ncbi:MAG: Xaa-Pro peptidase family protein [Isosphaeraceae bacterium]
MSLELLKKSARSGLAIVFAGFVAWTSPTPSIAQQAEVDGPDIPKAEFRDRRAKALEAFKDGIVVMLGTRDEEFGEFVKFRQRNDLQYLTGASQPDASLILVPADLAPDKKAREILFLPARNRGTEQWMGARVGPGTEGSEHYGIAEVLPADKFQSTLDSLIPAAEGHDGAKAPKVYIDIPRGHDSNFSREARLVEQLKKRNPGVTTGRPSQAIGELRKIKSPAEVALLQKAIDITGDGQREAARAIRPGAFEYEAQGALEGAFIKGGAERLGFFSIVGSGPNSCVLHYNDNRRKMKENELVVVDIGAEYHYYTADITRTYPTSGKFTPRQRQVYQLVLDAQKAAEDSFEVGKSNLGTLTAAAQRAMKESPLRDSKGNTLDRHFVHGLGHWVGMDVHDVGSYNGPLPVGSVFTIEPGIYLADEALGVRIEDDYLVTEKGLVKLSGKIPSAPDAIEALMASVRQP